MRLVKTPRKLLVLLLATLALLTPDKRLYDGIPAFDEASATCVASAVWHESRGEPLKGQRAIIDTIENRRTKTGLSYCEIVAQKHQWPWYRKKGLMPLTREVRDVYNAALEHPRVLTSENYIFFNRGRSPGVECKRIGRHRFCVQPTKERN